MMEKLKNYIDRLQQIYLIVCLIAFIGASFSQLFLPYFVASNSVWVFADGWQREIAFWNLEFMSLGSLPYLQIFSQGCLQPTALLRQGSSSQIMAIIGICVWLFENDRVLGEGRISLGRGCVSHGLRYLG